jgi:hypothetical protein
MTGLIYLALDGDGELALWTSRAGDDRDRVVMYRYACASELWLLVEEALAARLGRAEEKLDAVMALACMWPNAHGRAVARAIGGAA